MQNYSYPIDPSWSHQEMADVIALWNAVEAAYESGIAKEELLRAYRAFKLVVPAKGEEKRYGDQFEKETGYSLYRTVKAAQGAPEHAKIRMEKDQRDGKKRR